MTSRRDDAVIRAERSPLDPARIQAMASDPEAARVKREWMQFAVRHGYSYNFSWLGVPIIQHPEDIVIVQELLWRVRPDLVVETGIAHGGSLILSASILRLLGGDREVLGIDVDIRSHARATLSTHPLAGSISTIEGDSTAPDVIAQVGEICRRHRQVLVILDSNHTANHVSAELSLYADFVSVGSYLVVMDTVIKDLQPEAFDDRPWDADNNPWTAVHQFLSSDDRFRLAHDVDDRLLATSAPGGYLIRTR
ncbi:MAG: CmcI family methyltransferase [Acidimicrobiales bacterium]|jgi:cephalosporin hydroxylase